MTQLKYSHVAESAQHLCDADDHLRVRHILTEKFISYTMALELRNHVEYLFNQPTQTRASGLVIMGEPGNGKTKIAQFIMRQALANSTSTGRREIPVIMITMTGARDARTLFNRLLEALGAPNSSGMRHADREQLVLHLARAARLRLIIVDEIQDVLSSTPGQQRAALDTIKLLMIELAIPILCLGVKDAARAMQADPHLNARFDYKALPRWTVNNELRSLMAAIETNLPLREPSGLTTQQFMKAVATKSEGNLAKIIRLTNYAAIFGILARKERIDIELLDEAERRVPPAHVLNPPEGGPLHV